MAGMDKCQSYIAPRIHCHELVSFNMKMDIRAFKIGEYTGTPRQTIVGVDSKKVLGSGC